VGFSLQKFQIQQAVLWNSSLFLKGEAHKTGKRFSVDNFVRTSRIGEMLLIRRLIKGTVETCFLKKKMDS